MYLLIGIGAIVFVIWVWFELYKNLGYTPAVQDYCDYFSCSWPRDYNINLFGKIWSWSPLWIPLLAMLYFLLKSKSYRKQTTISLLLISIATGIYWLAPRLIPEKTFDSELISWGKSLNKEKYITKYSFSGNHSNTLNLTLDDEFDKLSYQEKFEFLENKIWNPFDVEWEYLLSQYDYSTYSASNRGRVDVSAHTSLGSYEANDGNIIDIDGTRYELDVFNGTINKGLNDAELKQEMEKRRIDLLNKEPSKGMFESDLQNTKWGKATKVEKSQEYDNKRPGYRYILYTWYLRFDTGEISEIRTAYVEEGIVTIVNTNKYTKGKK